MSGQVRDATHSSRERNNVITNHILKWIFGNEDGTLVVIHSASEAVREALEWAFEYALKIGDREILQPIHHIGKHLLKISPQIIERAARDKTGQSLINLLDVGLDPNARFNYQDTHSLPLIGWCFRNDVVNVAQCVLNMRDVDHNAIDGTYRRTPLHWAVFKSSKRILALLAEEYSGRDSGRAWVVVDDAQGVNVCIHACRNGDDFALELLKKLGIPCFSFQSVATACQVASLSCLRLLLKSHHIISSRLSVDEWRAVIDICCVHDRVNCLHAVVKAVRPLNISLAFALKTCIRKASLKCLDLCLQQEIVAVGDIVAALSLCVEHIQPDCMLIVLQAASCARFDANAMSDSYLDLLDALCAKWGPTPCRDPEQLELAHLCVCAIGKTLMREERFVQVLEAFISVGYSEALRTLLSNYSDFIENESIQNIAWEVAVRLEQRSCCEELCSFGWLPRGNDGEDILLFLIKHYGQVEAWGEFIDRAVRLCDPHLAGRARVVHALIQAHSFGLVEHILETRQTMEEKPNWDGVNDEGHSILNSLVVHNQGDLAIRVVYEGVDLAGSIRMNFFDTPVEGPPILVALEVGMYQLAYAILDHQPEMCWCTDARGRSPLLIAVERNYMELVQLIIASGFAHPGGSLRCFADDTVLMDVNCLTMAIANGNLDILKAVLNRKVLASGNGVRVEFRAPHFRSALYAAAVANFAAGAQELCRMIHEGGISDVDDYAITACLAFCIGASFFECAEAITPFVSPRHLFDVFNPAEVVAGKVHETVMPIIRGRPGEYISSNDVATSTMMLAALKWYDQSVSLLYLVRICLLREGCDMQREFFVACGNGNSHFVEAMLANGKIYDFCPSGSQQELEIQGVLSKATSKITIPAKLKRTSSMEFGDTVSSGLVSRLLKSNPMKSGKSVMALSSETFQDTIKKRRRYRLSEIALSAYDVYDCVPTWPSSLLECLAKNHERLASLLVEAGADLQRTTSWLEKAMMSPNSYFDSLESSKIIGRLSKLADLKTYGPYSFDSAVPRPVVDSAAVASAQDVRLKSIICFTGWQDWFLREIVFEYDMPEADDTALQEKLRADKLRWQRLDLSDVEYVKSVEMAFQEHGLSAIRFATNKQESHWFGTCVQGNKSRTLKVSPRGREVFGAACVLEGGIIQALSFSTRLRGGGYCEALPVHCMY